MGHLHCARFDDPMTHLHEILYCSVLAPDLEPGIVGKLVGQARARNAVRQISGLLVFDGLRFCQHIEGPPRELMRLMDRIGQDPRHTDVRVVYEGALDARRYRRFDMGYADIEGPSAMAGVRELDGAEALAHFLALRSGFDVSG
ncbi:MAG: blue light sensor protein [Variovorax sp.]|nr:blue light sensor protein [Variovorax sp.]